MKLRKGEDFPSQDANIQKAILLLDGGWDRKFRPALQENSVILSLTGVFFLS